MPLQSKVCQTPLELEELVQELTTHERYPYKLSELLVVPLEPPMKYLLFWKRDQPPPLPLR